MIFHSFLLEKKKCRSCGSNNLRLFFLYFFTSVVKMSKFALSTLFLSLFSNWWIIFFRRFASAADPNSENNRDPNLPLCLSCIRQYCWCCPLPSPDSSGSSAKIFAGNIKVFIEWRRMKRRLDFPVQFGMLLSKLWKRICV